MGVKHHIFNTYTMKRMISFFVGAVMTVSTATQAQNVSSCEKQAEELKSFNQKYPQEKVFLHMDNTCYFLGDTIWFKAYTRQTDTGAPSGKSGVLYVELLNHDGYLMERKLIEM